MRAAVSLPTSSKSWFAKVAPDFPSAVEIPNSVREAGFVTAPPILPSPRITPAIFKAQQHKSDQPLDWGKATRDVLATCYEPDAAVLIRNLPIKNANELKELVQTAGFGLDLYDGVNRRNQVLGDDVYETTFSSNGLVYGFAHNEFFYRPGECNTIMFYCVKPADVGGESVLVRNDELTDIMGQDSLDYILSKGGIRDIFFSPSRDTTNKEGSPYKGLNSWQEVVGSEDRADAEAYWSAKWEQSEWDEDGNLTVSTTNSGHTLSPVTGERLWYNGLTGGHKFSTFFSMTWGNGEPIDQDFVQLSQTAMFKAATAFKLQAGDLLIMDNRQVLHGKLPHLGDARRLWVMHSRDV